MFMVDCTFPTPERWGGERKGGCGSHLQPWLTRGGGEREGQAGGGRRGRSLRSMEDGSPSPFPDQKDFCVPVSEWQGSEVPITVSLRWGSEEWVASRLPAPPGGLLPPGSPHPLPCPAQDAAHLQPRRRTPHSPRAARCGQFKWDAKINAKFTVLYK